MNFSNIENFFLLSQGDFGLKKSTIKFLKSKYGYNKNGDLQFLRKQHSEIIKAAFNPEKSMVPNEQTQIIENINFITTLQTNKGVRHQRHLPVRGQSTRTNAKTNIKRYRFLTTGSVKKKKKKNKKKQNLKKKTYRNKKNK